VAINKAFRDWEAAHAAYVEAERRLADAETVFAFTRANEPVELRREVARKRAESDRLLQIAMELLHSRMTGAKVK
jgi:transposase-like protein